MMELSQINCCIIIPTYNNEKTLSKVIDEVLTFSMGNDVIVINDGATDSTAAILEGYKNKVIIIKNEKNIGKGFSLRKGFKEAIVRGFENAITIDSDGQHFPDDISKLITVAIKNPGSLLMGSRNMEHDDVPGKSSFGNKFSNFWFWVETGLTLPDTQTGFRLYPLAPIKSTKLFTVKFETEIEVIVKLAWKNVNILPVNTRVLYDINERVSHFRPFQDFTRISILNTYLVTLTLLYYLPKRILLKIFRKGLFNLIKEEALNPNESTFTKSSSIAFGFFMGVIPLWGFQLLIGIPLAILFRMNKVLFIAAANISIPPMIPVIVFLSYYLGSFFVDSKVHFENLQHITLETIHINIVQYIIGAIVLAIVLAILSFCMAMLVFTRLKKNRL